MEHKTKEAYRELFNSVDTCCTQLDCAHDPVIVVSDFEVAAKQAVREVFGDGIEMLFPAHTSNMAQVIRAWAGDDVQR